MEVVLTSQSSTWTGFSPTAAVQHPDHWPYRRLLARVSVGVAEMGTRALLRSPTFAPIRLWENDAGNYSLVFSGPRDR